jgi:hypothetical protein
MKEIIIAALMLTSLINKPCFGQSTNNSIGGDYFNQSGTVSFTIGEICYQNKGVNYTLIEGIQNGYTINPNSKHAAINVSIFPNPTSDLIYFKVQNLYFDKLVYSVYNNLGIELLNGQITNQAIYVSLKQFPAAVYLINIYREKAIIMTYQVIKIN